MATDTKQPFTLDEHKVIGESLLAIRNYLKDLADDVTDRYGKPVCRKRMGYTVAAVDRVRSGLSQQLFEDQNVTPPSRELASVYFPPVRQASGPSEAVQA